MFDGKCGCGDGLFGGNFIWWILIIIFFLCFCNGERFFN